ncbi:MAG: MarR family winged helix-turn-helix transcriptional regulator [Thermomicrobiales bacterium]
MQLITDELAQAGVLERPRHEEIARWPLELLLRRWHHLVWQQALRPVFHRMLEHDLSLAEWITLRSVQHHPLTIADVATTRHFSHSAASRAVERLVRDGLLSRREHPDDRRQKLLTLTPQGEALLAEIELLFSQQLDAFVASLDEQDREQVRLCLGRWLAKLSAEPDCSTWRAASTEERTTAE